MTDVAARESVRASTLSRVLEHIALVLIGVAGPLVTTLRSPIYNSADEAAHVDYAFQLWHGAFPVFEAGLALQNTVGVHPQVQWTSQHPPLFYLLLSPVVGPLADAGHVNAAGMAARLVVVALSLGLIYASRWVAGLLIPGTPAVRLGAPLVIGVSAWFPVLGGVVYNDIFALLMTLLALGSLLAIVRRPDRARWGIAFGLACAAGSLARFTFLPVAFALCLGLVVIAVIDRRVRRLGLAAAVGAAGAMAVASGWFYLRNLELTGSVTGTHLPWFIEQGLRSPRPTLEVVSDLGWWMRMLDQFGPVASGQAAASVAPWLVVGLFLLPAIAGVVLYVVRVRRTSSRRAVDLVLGALVVAIVGGLVVMEIQHYAQGGGANVRYFFVLVVLLAPFIAMALVLPARWAPLLIVWIAVRLVVVSVDLADVLGRPLQWTWRPEADSALVFPLPTLAAYGGMLVGVVLATALIVRMRRPRSDMEGWTTG